MDANTNRFRMTKQDTAQRPVSSTAQPALSHQVPPQKEDAPKAKKSGTKRKLTIGFAIVVAVVLLAVLWFFVVAPKNEASRVDGSKYQAVFLQGSSPYFGKITAINDEFIELSDVFYLQLKNGITTFADAKSADDIALIKLGCEIHGPEDVMIIKQSSVLYWENLRSDAQVPTAIDSWNTANPDGQTCSPAAAQQDTQPVADQEQAPPTNE